MAKSYAHTYGEIIGDFFEASMIQYLKPTVERLGFYLDYRHERPARNGQREVRWADAGGNKHKLDIVIEEDGSEAAFGNPRAFIEMAWRRYSKHSKNKVQEISGAVLPLIETYRTSAPFYSAVLSGEFTSNALQQLRSQGFTVCYIGLEQMERVFSDFGFTVTWAENASETSFEQMVAAYHLLSAEEREALYTRFIQLNSEELEAFRDALVSSLTRKPELVTITPIHGREAPFPTAQDACAFVGAYDETRADIPVLFYEVKIRFNTQETYSYRFKEKEKALAFLRQYI